MSFSRLSLGATFPQSLALFKAYIKKKKKSKRACIFLKFKFQILQALKINEKFLYFLLPLGWNKSL